MNELSRLDYLEAMGITQYVARAPLAGARPSPIIPIAPQPSEQQTIEQQPIEQKTTERPIRISELLDNKLPYKNTATLTETVLTTLDPQVSAAQLASSTIFHCQIAIWTVGDILVLADAPRIDNNQLTLLRNILQAIQRTEPLSDTTQFTWPLPQRKDKTLQAAREHFQGLLDGGLLKTEGLRQILCFGSAMTTLLSSNDSASNSLQQYQDWPLTTVCSLHDMLIEPSRKADTWRILQVLVRV